MMRRILIPCLILLVALAFAIPSISASSQTMGAQSPSQQPFVAGNYCVSCHLADDPRLSSATEWRGGIARETNSPCPAATSIHEQLYYSERMLLMIDRAEQSAGMPSAKDQTRLAAYTQLYSRQLDEPVTSLDAFVTQAQTARYRLNKIYTVLNQIAEAAKRRVMLIGAGLVTLFVLGSLLWGLYNARVVGGANARRPRSLFWRGLFVLAVLAFFALPFLRLPAEQTVMPTLEEQDTQTVLDSANRAALTADRAQARAWMLARLGAAWNETNPPQAQSAFEEALASIQQGRENKAALWGQSLAVQEVTVGVSSDMEKADLIAVDLNAARARDWSIPLIAIDLDEVDSAQASALLQANQEALKSQAGVYRDLQMRGVTLAWAKIDPSKAAAAGEAIGDASIRAWTLREAAGLAGDSTLFGRAAEAARQVAEPVQRARALREVAVASGDNSLFGEALSALDGVNGASLAYALSDLAAASGNASLVNQIDPSYPDARAAALLRLSRYQDAWDAASAIADPYEQARAQAAIAGGWGNVDAAMGISVTSYRDLALRDVIRKTGNSSALDSIQSPYYKIQALTALGQYEAAIQASDALGDSYPLVALATALAQQNQTAALSLVDKMTRETDKAAALRVIAASSGDQDVFERALGLALAARASGNVLMPCEASLDLANALWDVNPVGAQSALLQAYQATQLIQTQ